jgi:hypothetical protein
MARFGADGILSGLSAKGSNKAGHGRGCRHRKAIGVAQPALTGTVGTAKAIVKPSTHFFSFFQRYVNGGVITFIFYFFLNIYYILGKLINMNFDILCKIAPCLYSSCSSFFGCLRLLIKMFLYKNVSTEKVTSDFNTLWLFCGFLDSSK